MMRRLTRIAEVRAEVDSARRAGRRVGLVPTMGALHAGHLSLVRLAAERADLVVVSVFVNPTQFGPDEDLAAYPRDLAGDESKLAALGAATPHIVFAPDVAEVYPLAPASAPTTVTVRGLSEVLCGRGRPGHFDGVATVVTKLLSIVTPDVAVFGRKDFQQLQVIRALVRDLDIPVEIVGGPTVREPGGVAMSSRNAYFDADARRAAQVLSRALADAVRVARHARDAGWMADPDVIRRAAAATLAAERGVDLDYLEVVDPDTLSPPDSQPSGERDEAAGAHSPEPHLLVAVAAHVGPARLIDNVVVGDVADEQRLLDAVSGQH